MKDTANLCFCNRCNVNAAPQYNGPMRLQQVL